MVAVAKKSPIADRLEKELGAEFELHKNDETTYGSGSDLPAGINGGIAQLVEAKIDEYPDGDNKGKLYLYLAGIVKSPDTVNGVKVAGLRAQKSVKLFANNRDSKEQAVAKALNEVRKMGGITGDIKARDLPVLMDALKSEGTHFRFRTYAYTPPGAKEGDDPIIVTEFRGKYDGTVEAGGGGVIDNTGTPSDNGTSQSDEVDWDEVLAQANNDDGEAQTKLQDTCKAIGMSAEEVEAAASWEDLVAYIKAGGSSEGSGGEANDEWKPEAGEEVTVKLKGMKSAQKLKIKKVFKETLHLYNEATKKDFQGVEWTANPATVGGVAL